MNTDENDLTEIILQLVGDEDNTKAAVKRRMRMMETQEDIIRGMVEGKPLTPSDLAKYIGLAFLFQLERKGLLSFSYDDPYEWIEFKNACSVLTEYLDSRFTFKKERGRPASDGTKALSVFGSICLDPAKPACRNLGKCQHNYVKVLTAAVRLRLAKSELYKKTKVNYEKQ
jgi:hypothetical protein